VYDLRLNRIRANSSQGAKTGIMLPRKACWIGYFANVIGQLLY
jgi:hypothetical protein